MHSNVLFNRVQNIQGIGDPWLIGKSFLVEGVMHNLREDRKTLSLANNLRLRSKLTLILKRKTGSTTNFVDTQREGRSAEPPKIKDFKWIEPTFVNIGNTFHGLSATDQKKLQQKSGSFCSLHQLLELKSAQMSKSYRVESKRICFDPIGAQLRRFAVQELSSKRSLASDISVCRRVSKIGMKDAVLKDLNDRTKFLKNDLAATWEPVLNNETGWHTPRYNGCVKSLSIASKTSSLPNIIVNDAEEKNVDSRLVISVL